MVEGQGIHRYLSPCYFSLETHSTKFRNFSEPELFTVFSFIILYGMGIIDISTYMCLQVDIVLGTKIPDKVDIEDDVTRTCPHGGEGLDNILKHSINYIKG